MSAIARSEPRLSINVAMNATLRLKRSSLATSKVALRLLASAIAAASCGRSLRLPLSTSTNSAICSPLAYEIAAHGLALRLDTQLVLALPGGRNPQIADIAVGCGNRENYFIEQVSWSNAIVGGGK